MTIQFAIEQERQLEDLATASGQSLNALVSEVLTTYLDSQIELLAELTQARADLAAGWVFTTEQVRKQIGKLLAAS